MYHRSTSKLTLKREQGKTIVMITKGELINMSKTYRVLIGDDHKHARQAMRLILANDERFEIVERQSMAKKLSISWRNVLRTWC